MRSVEGLAETSLACGAVLVARLGGSGELLNWLELVLIVSKISS